MRYIKLDYKDVKLFDTCLNDEEYEFYYTHRDAFRQMFKEQVNFVLFTGKTCAVLLVSILLLLLILLLLSFYYQMN